MACRNAEKGKMALSEILKKTGDVTGVGEIVLESLDLASLQSVRDFATLILQRECRIDILINNAGIMMCPKNFTVDGFELQFGTNHLGHFLLTMLLLPRILNSTPARIVNVSSLAHRLAGRLDWDNLNAEKSYGPIKNYAVSKLANVLFTQELARRLEGKKVNVYSLHPGVVNTELSRHVDTMVFPGAYWLYRHVCSFFQKSIEQGAQTSIYCAVDDKVANESGYYYADCKHAAMSNQAQDVEVAGKLWEVSLKKVNLDNYDPFKVIDTLPERN